MTTCKIGLALGSGASRGWAHIGVIEALQDANIPIHFVTGCSVGAFVGAIYASGGLEHLKRFVIDMDGESMFSFSDLSLIRSGLLNGDKKVKELFCMHTDKKEFEALEIPLKVVAADMHSGDQVVLDTGDLLKALRASMAYPGLFAPVFHKGRWLIDGGVVDPVPVGVTRAMGADIVIAVNLDSQLISHRRQQKSYKDKTKSEITPPGVRNEFLKNLANRYEAAEKIIRKRLELQKKEKQKPPSTRKVINGAIQLMQDRITRVNFAVNPPDILINPRLGDLKMLDYDQVEHSIEEGYIATRNKISDIQMLMALQASD
ncbi:NTE family protein [Desulfocicer vacuolatum DSM 3385]|uniref:NTE family protein n=1 Tax=Desulfocicer vacuolatum DSM 3385 TaxID=1121400 RepID=A0A1W2EB47_9BACT|nr:patatin-like phospholipase family protein [Desulfocicer vacuolatum]SMD06973.1 NTE family protein [Desulfocicer vacuolatum DSM 3385]